MNLENLSRKLSKADKLQAATQALESAMTKTVMAHAPAILEAAAELNDTKDAKYLASVFLQVTQKASLMLTRDLEIVVGLDLPAIVSVRHTTTKKGGVA